MFGRRRAELFLAIVLLISWGSGVAVHAPALVLFPLLILSVAATSIVLILVLDGPDGLRRLRAQQTTWRLGGWYGVVFLPPALILVVLLALRAAAGSAFTPNHFRLGFAFGIPAGVFEELGWTGFALPALASRLGWKRASVIIGVLWGLWHLPVVDSLGAASPHGTWLPAFVAAFVLALSALRVVISWAVTRTRSLLIAQLIHISSTGSLVMLGPFHVAPAQEALWYAGYGIVLWTVAGILLVRSRR